MSRVHADTKSNLNFLTLNNKKKIKKIWLDTWKWHYWKKNICITFLKFKISFFYPFNFISLNKDKTLKYKKLQKHLFKIERKKRINIEKKLKQSCKKVVLGIQKG